MISIANYSDSIKSVDVNSLPQTLQEGHQFFIEAQSVYDQDESIKETIDIYLQKLNEYLEAKDSKIETDSGSKEVNSKSTSPPKAKNRVNTAKAKIESAEKSKPPGKKAPLKSKPAEPVSKSQLKMVASQSKDVLFIKRFVNMHYKVKDQGRVVSRAVYNVLGISQEGRKELIGMYISESEGAKFWLSVLTDLKSRGVEDILIACVDGLKGFPEAIETVFPQAQIQTCVIHQIRNTRRYVVEKDKKEFMADLKPVYQAVNKEEGYFNLLALEEKWSRKYPVAVQSWLNNWEYLSTFFAYDQEIRRVIYTTNTIEGFHRQVRKVTKTKGAFTSDAALQKLIYLVVMNVSKKWTVPLRNWPLTFSQLYIMFEERIKLHVRV